MKWGDNLRTSIDEGLLNSRFGIVVFSKAFLKKKRWTEHELNGLFAKERAGVKVILPIWHEVTQEDLERNTALLSLTASRLIPTRTQSRKWSVA
jgi:TIR domain